MAAVRDGLLSLHQALDRYSLSMDEYLSWHQQANHFGLEGLRVDAARRTRRNRKIALDDLPDEQLVYGEARRSRGNP